jgi:hypothetical protein
MFDARPEWIIVAALLLLVVLGRIWMYSKQQLTLLKEIRDLLEERNEHARKTPPTTNG